MATAACNRLRWWLAAAAASVAWGGWSMLGGDANRRNVGAVQLPNAATGVQVATRIPGMTGSGGMLPPLVTTQGNTVLTIAPDAACVISFYDGGGVLQGRWAGCAPGDRLLVAPPSLDVTGNTLVVITFTGNAYGVDTRLATLGATLWGPLALGVEVTTSPLVLLGLAWVVPSPTTSTGDPTRLLHIDTTLGRLESFLAPTCNGTADVWTAPPTLLYAPSSRVVTVSSLGCVVAWSSTGSVVWSTGPVANGTAPTARAATGSWAHRQGLESVPHPGGVPSDAPAAAPAWLSPSVDVTSGHIYLAAEWGMLCCLNTDGTRPCAFWLTPCVQLPNAYPLVGGLSSPPPTNAFHNGQVFAIDASGQLYAVLTQNGAIAASGLSLSLGPVAAAPIVVPNGLGDGESAALIASRDGTLYAVYVGDAAVTDDDTSSDDDSNANDGVAWLFSTAPTASPMPPTPPSITALGMALRDDGCIVLPFTDGSIVTVGPTKSASPPASEAVIIVASTLTAAALLLAVGLTVWCACRSRPRPTEEEEDDEAGAADGVPMVVAADVEEDKPTMFTHGGSLNDTPTSLYSSPAFTTAALAPPAVSAVSGYVPPDARLDGLRVGEGGVGPYALHPARPHMHYMSSSDVARHLLQRHTGRGNASVGDGGGSGSSVVSGGSTTSSHVHPHAVAVALSDGDHDAASSFNNDSVM